MDRLRKLMAACLLTILLIAGCVPADTSLPPPTATEPGTLIPYRTHTPTPSPSALANTPTPIPSATPTAQTYQIKKGDDLFGIAFAHGVSPEALKTANPTVNPHFLIVGSSLVIPPVTPAPETPAATQASPTPSPISLGSVRCFQAGPDGAWCLVLVTNAGQESVENLSASIRLANAEAGSLTEQTATAPLNVLPGGASLPLAAYFEGTLPAGSSADAQLQEALPMPADDTRYLPVRLDAATPEIAADGQSARASGNVLLGEDAAAEASLVWVAAIAYDTTGEPVGMRKWESGEALKPGSSLPFDLTVYSLGPAITRVDLRVEAHR